MFLGIGKEPTLTNNCQQYICAPTIGMIASKPSSSPPSPSNNILDQSGNPIQDQSGANIEEQ